MKRIAEAAAAQLATRPGSDEPITSEEMVRVLARIARTGPPAARLRAIELLSTRMALFPEATGASPLAALSDEERAGRIEASSSGPASGVLSPKGKATSRACHRSAIETRCQPGRSRGEAP